MGPLVKTSGALGYSRELWPALAGVFTREAFPPLERGGWWEEAILLPFYPPQPMVLVMEKANQMKDHFPWSWT